MASKRYMELLEEMKDLQYEKIADTQEWTTLTLANFRVSQAFGVSPFLGALVRMSDKYIRVTNLVKNPRTSRLEKASRIP